MTGLQPTLETYLNLIRPRLDEALVNESAFDAMLGIAKVFPALPYAGFETDLQSEDANCDLSLLLDNCTADEEYPDRSDPTLSLPGELRLRPCWNRICRICSAFRCGTAGLRDVVSSIWVEFDLICAQSVIPNPSVFVGIRKMPPSVSGAPLGPRYFERMRQVLDILHGGEPQAELLQTLEALVCATAERADGYHLGVMLSRPGAPIRLCIRRTPARELLSDVDEIQGPGSTEVARAKLGQYIEMAPNPTIHLDIASTIGPRIGFDFTFARSCITGQPADEPRWKEMFDLLVSDGLCTTGNRNLLLRWPGGCRLTDAAGHAIPGDISYLVRELNHIKISAESDGKLSAKGYFGYQHIQQSATAAATTHA
jgi:hypothetical protein